MNPPVAYAFTLGSFTSLTRSTPLQSTPATLAATDTTLLNPLSTLFTPRISEFIALSILAITLFIAPETPLLTLFHKLPNIPATLSFIFEKAFFIGVVTCSLNQLETLFHTPVIAVFAELNAF